MAIEIIRSDLADDVFIAIPSGFAPGINETTPSGVVAILVAIAVEHGMLMVEDDE